MPRRQRGEELARYMVARRGEVYDGPITLNRRADLYELRVPKAVSFYEEHVFHDNSTDTQWFHDHLTEVARSAAKGLCDYFGIVFREPQPSLSAPLYRVQVGAFRDADNARAFLATVRAAGFGEAFITTVNP